MGLQYNFGVGQVALIPPGANPTPVNISVLQDVSLDISFTTKELRGNLQFPVDIARGAGKITGKAKTGVIAGGLLSAILNTTSSTGSKLGVLNEIAPVPASPYTITVANSATWVEDLGVYDATAGKFLKCVASAPATGQYSVAAGVYTFAAADTTHSMQISYSYSSASVGITNSLQNSLMGTSTVFKLELFNNFRGNGLGFVLPAVTIPKLSLPMKAEDYTIMDLDFEAFADSTGKVIDFYSAQ